ncbi:MAG: acyltransferase domain-containing protein, partial [Ilumatobacter sp.]|uniref:type I polyketide synthase n=1 Tax=Ilumatobacter sp. TaxID=1967498 RepID=UPI003C713EE1
MNRPMWLQGMRRAGVAEDVALNAVDEILALHPEWTESTFPGLLGNVVAGRIANRLDLGGTNCVTDAACASSFSAISMGVNELYLGDSDLVIAGGVDTMNDIFMYMCFSKTPALSKSEEIRPFSDQADGTMLGEGLGMFALKRLADAERDGNNIYAVINGVGSSSDGRSKSVYAPVSSGQARAIDAAYAKAGYGPETVELVEAHGTGTVAGDAAEFGGLQLAFGSTGRADRQWCALGSVKSQIGHTKAAAGAAGLFKVIMALHHKVLPQTAKIERPNPQLDLENSPFHLNTESRPWVRGHDHERRGAVSSFGFGGSNFHITLSEYTGSGVRAPRLPTRGPELVTITGADSADVIAKSRALVDQAADTDLRLIARLSHAERASDANVRLAVVATDGGELRELLETAIARIETDPAAAFTTPSGISYGVGEHAGDVAFVFPGQGSQYVSMGAPVAMHFDEAMKAWDAAATRQWGDTSLQEVVFPFTTFDADAAAVETARITETQWAQPAIGTTSLSMLRLLRAGGVDAAHFAGHSFGEVTALHAAGVLSEVDMIDVARRRGELMAEAAQTPGSMTAVVDSIESVRTLVEQSGAEVVVANHNSPTQVVLSGPTPEVDRMEAHLKESGVRFTRLPVATAFHSPVVSGASDAFSTYLDSVAFDAPTSAVYSNTTAQPYPANDVDAMRSQLGHQLANPVRFVEMIEAMYEAGARTFVEVGPGSILTGLVGKVLGDREHVAIQLDKKGTDDLAPLVHGLGQLVAAGIDVDLDALWSSYLDPSEAADADAPKLAIPINGKNFDSPYPPADLTELVGPNPAVPQQPVPQPSPAPTPADAPIASAPQALQQPAPATPTSTPTAQFAPAAPAAAPQARPAAGSGVLAAYQAAQQQTADAHTAYLASMGQAHAAFLDAAQQSLTVLGRLAGVDVETTTSSPPAVTPSPATASPVPASPVPPVPASP